MIRNKTKNKVLAKDFKRLGGVRKIIGLLGESSNTVLFKTRFGIHTFFLKKPIDLLVLDKNQRVVFLRKDVKPNRFVVWKILYDTVIELPKGSIEKSNTKISDLLEIS